jgi:signal peptidase II
MKAVLHFSRWGFILTLLGLTIGCDQTTKRLARQWLADAGTLSYAGGTVRLEHAQNPGAFLSLGADLDGTWRFWLFIVATGAFLAYVGWLLATRKDLSRGTLTGLTLVLGGGLGNLIDRLIFGSVTDFMILGFESLRTGVFNVADMAIVAGTLLLS